MHVTPDSIAECEALIDYVIKISNQNQCDNVVFLGDQFNTHSILHLSVIDFWFKSFTKLVDSECNVITLIR
jgi:hypothetical protein